MQILGSESFTKWLVMGTITSAQARGLVSKVFVS